MLYNKSRKPGTPKVQKKYRHRGLTKMQKTRKTCRLTVPSCRSTTERIRLSRLSPGLFIAGSPGTDTCQIWVNSTWRQGLRTCAATLEKRNERLRWEIAVVTGAGTGMGSEFAVATISSFVCDVVDETQMLQYRMR